jgi:hypothetical protein
LGLIVIPKEAKMADIIKSDVQTYVRELIAKEFGTYTKAEKVPSDIRKTISGESRNGQHRPLYNQPFGGTLDIRK